MSYAVIGIGPQFPKPHRQEAQTAGEALQLLPKVRKLCGTARVVRSDGVELSDHDLVRAAKGERDA